MANSVKMTDKEHEVLNKICDLIDNDDRDLRILADFIGLKSVSVISDWRAERSKSFTRYIPKIAEYFDKTYEDIYGKVKVDLFFSNCPSVNVIADESSQTEVKSAFELNEDEKELIEIYRLLNSEGRTIVKAEAFKEKRNQQEAEETKENVG